ncbi:(3,5-dihydroxyphenyl)acetyl-CoA 1,2-dioxygenase DpgC [Micromonospora sp. NPDC000089]|uniref:(3,5-dihydroxyphenyl)acetyl-CoA 1,2-dioxygenase DpgC n=1 Tax=unclassified Micromonospora TaxID=2617518 RepID=UPI00369835DE
MSAEVILDRQSSPRSTVSTATGDLHRDARTLAQLASIVEELLELLPSRSMRTPDEQRRADYLLAPARAARRAFLATHVDAVYDVLTDNRSRHLRLGDLMFAAAERFPGLVPDRARMRAEAGLIQAERDGWEIDQAILCSAVLGSPVPGRHLIDAMLRPTVRSTSLAKDFRQTGRIELDSVRVERRGPAAHVTFHNPHCLNAEDNQLIADLETAVDLVLLDPQVRVGVLRGGTVDHPRYQGRRVFSAGINLKSLRNGEISFVDFLLGRELGYLHKIWRGLLTDPETNTWVGRTVQKPWVGAVDTFAIGGGMQLLLVLDLVIADTDAYFSLPAAAEGIVPGVGPLRLARITGPRLARQILLGGRRIDAAEADGRLICDEVVPSSGMDTSIEKAVNDLAAPAVAANRRMLHLAEEPLDLYREYLAEFAVVQATRAYSADVLAKVEQRWQRSHSAHRANGVPR